MSVITAHVSYIDDDVCADIATCFRQIDFCSTIEDSKKVIINPIKSTVDTTF